MNSAVVNFAVGGWYTAGQERLRQSLAVNGFTGAFYGWTSHEQIGCRPHHEVPYAFKPAAVLNAAKRGHEVVLWCDASVYAIKPIDGFVDQAKSRGNLLFDSGWTCGQWSHDASLAKFGLTRDQAMAIPMVYALCMAFDVQDHKTAEMLLEWSALSVDGTTFEGPWINDGSCSADPRCLGHRHDQTAISLLAHKYGFKLFDLNDRQLLFCPGPGRIEPPEAIVAAQGM